MVELSCGWGFDKIRKLSIISRMILNKYWQPHFKLLGAILSKVNKFCVFKTRPIWSRISQTREPVRSVKILVGCFLLEILSWILFAWEDVWWSWILTSLTQSCLSSAHSTPCINISTFGWLKQPNKGLQFLKFKIKMSVVKMTEKYQKLSKLLLQFPRYEIHFNPILFQ